MDFSEMVANQLRDRMMSQADLSRISGLSTARIAQIVTGKTKDPRLSSAVAIADALGLSLDYLAGRNVAEKPTYDDPNQESLNGYYESMNSGGRAALVESARLMSGSPDTKIQEQGRAL